MTPQGFYFEIHTFSYPSAMDKLGSAVSLLKGAIIEPRCEVRQG